MTQDEANKLRTASLLDLLSDSTNYWSDDDTLKLGTALSSRLRLENNVPMVGWLQSKPTEIIFFMKMTLGDMVALLKCADYLLPHAKKVLAHAVMLEHAKLL